MVLAGIVLRSRPGSARNDSTRGYGIAGDYSRVIRTYGTSRWEKEVENIVKIKGKLSDRIDSREGERIQVRIPNRERIYMSLGKHNELHRRIIEDMIPVFCHHFEILYMGDTAMKQLVNERKKLEVLNFFELKHGLLPDIAYSKRKNLLYLIEAVCMSNPFSSHRKMEMENVARGCKAGIVYISAFLSRADFRGFVTNIAWETEVWIAEDPEHMIHFNGDKFLGQAEPATYTAVR